MPTIISHAAVPLALGIGLGEKRIPRALLAAGVVASMLPDADVILFRFGASYDTPWAHRGFSHSLTFAILLGALAALILKRCSPPSLAFAFVAVSAASHGLLDMMTNGGHGVAVLWPFTNDRYFFDWRPIRVAPLALSRFPPRAAAIVRTEFLWIWVPAIIVALGLRFLAPTTRSFDMKTRKLGDSDLHVSEISLGSWLTYGVGVEADKARACLDEAFNQGINFIDTANIYGRGAAETFLGEALQGRPRDSYVLATKLYFPMTATDRGLSREQIDKQLTDSLRRLKTDYIDLYQCHRYDWDTPLEETMDGLTRAVDSGKVRAIGFSEWPAERIRAAIDLAGSGRVAKFVSSQPQYSLLWREPEDEVIPLCAANGISQIVWSPLGQGVLSGKYDPAKPPPKDSRAASAEMGGFIDRLMQPQLLRAVQQLKPIAAEAGLTLPQFSLAWVLREPNVASAIIGASRPEQVRENAAASGVVVDTQLFLRAEAILDEALSHAETA